MSLNLVLSINNEDVTIPETTSEETKHILCGLLETTSSKHHPDRFKKVMSKFNEFAVEYSARQHDVDNDAVKAVIAIDSALENQSKGTEVVFSFF